MAQLYYKTTDIRFSISYFLSYKFYIPQDRIKEIEISPNRFNVNKLSNEFGLEPFVTGADNDAKPYGFKLIRENEIAEHLERLKARHIELGIEPEIVEDYNNEAIEYYLKNFKPTTSKDLLYAKRIKQIQDFLVEKCNTDNKNQLSNKNEVNLKELAWARFKRSTKKRFSDTEIYKALTIIDQHKKMKYEPLIRLIQSKHPDFKDINISTYKGKNNKYLDRLIRFYDKKTSNERI